MLHLQFFQFSPLAFFSSSTCFFWCFDIRSIPYRFGGACFLSDTLLSICHDVVAFTGIATFSGLLLFFGASLSFLKYASFGYSLVELSFSVVVDEMSIIEGGISSSNSMAISGVFVVPCIWVFPFL